MAPEDAPQPDLSAAVGNIKRTVGKGPGGEEEHPGTRHLRGGAKVYVIDAFWGQCEAVTVIGQHRKVSALHPASHAGGSDREPSASSGLQPLGTEANSGALR